MLFHCVIFVNKYVFAFLVSNHTLTTKTLLSNCLFHSQFSTNHDRSIVRAAWIWLFG